MGKQEREQILLLEKSIVNVLNGNKPIISQGDRWYKHLDPFVEKIKSDFKGIIKAIHIGNVYGPELGNIKLILENGTNAFIELKASESETGKGTLANISQDSLTKYEIIYHPKNEKILSWSEWRKKTNFSSLVEEQLDRMPYYSRSISFEEKARKVKELAGKGDKKATLVKAKIMEIAKHDKLSYIRYIKNFNINEENLSKFLCCLLSGIHTEKEILKFFSSVSKSDIERSYEVLTLYYSNVRTGKVIVTKQPNKIKELLAEYSDFELVYPSEASGVVNTYITAKNKTNGKIAKILNFVFHWKNIFQGIKTPCINVFLGPFFY